MCCAVESNASEDLLKITERTLRKTFKNHHVIYDSTDKKMIMVIGKRQFDHSFWRLCQIIMLLKNLLMFLETPLYFNTNSGDWYMLILPVQLLIQYIMAS